MKISTFFVTFFATVTANCNTNKTNRRTAEDLINNYILRVENQKFSHPLTNAPVEFLPKNYGSYTEMYKDKCKRSYNIWLMHKRKRPRKEEAELFNVGIMKVMI